MNVLLPPSLCDSCKRLKSIGYCSAFPDGIPAEIMANLVDHRNPVEGDHGLQFLEDPDRNDTLPAALQAIEFNAAQRDS